jgi:hypothetical protein
VALGEEERRHDELEAIVNESGMLGDEAREARVQYFALFARDLSIIEFPPEVQPQADELIVLSLEASRLAQLVADAPRLTTVEEQRSAAATVVAKAVIAADIELEVALDELGLALGLMVSDEGENDEVAPVASED